MSGSVHRHRLAVFHEDDEHRNIGIQSLDEGQRLAHLVGSFSFRAQHEGMTIADAVSQKCSRVSSI